MNAKQFFIQVMRMREAQKQYFKTRSQSAQKESKFLESMVDNEIERVKAMKPDDREINPKEPQHLTLNLEQ